MLKVTKFQAKNAKAVSRIMRAAFKSFLKDKYNKDDEKCFSPSGIAGKALAKSASAETTSFVVWDQNIIVGYIRISAARNGLGSLDVIGVDPECFARGAGAMLMKASENFWQRKKMRKISTCVSSHNKRALVYYIKNNFVPEGYRRDHFREGVDEVILGRFL